MKGFIKYLLIFAIPVVLALAASEALVRHCPNTYSYKDQWMEAHAGEVETLILGSSHNYYAIQPSLLPGKAFSLAGVSQNPEYDNFLFFKYASKCKRLRNVVLLVDECNLYEPPLEQGPEWYRCIYYHLYMGYGKHGTLSRYGYELASMGTFHRKLNDAIKYAITGHTQLGCDSLGFGADFYTPAAVDTAYLASNAAESLKRNTFQDWSYVAGNEAYIEQIAQYCHAHGINVIITNPPATKYFYQGVAKRQLAETKRFATQCKLKYNATYLDWLTNSNFSGTDFSDADHLSQQGARKFTLMLLSYLAL